MVLNIYGNKFELKNIDKGCTERVLDSKIHLEVPKGLKISHPKNRNTYNIKLHRTMYELK